MHHPAYIPLAIGAFGIAVALVVEVVIHVRLWRLRARSMGSCSTELGARYDQVKLYTNSANQAMGGKTATMMIQDDPLPDPRIVMRAMASMRGPTAPPPTGEFIDKINGR